MTQKLTGLGLRSSSHICDDSNAGLSSTEQEAWWRIGNREALDGVRLVHTRKLRGLPREPESGAAATAHKETRHSRASALDPLVFAPWLEQAMVKSP